MLTTLPLTGFRSDDRAVSSVTIVALLILATLLISVVLALFILGMGV
jgi:FlaG/FlaF family flagellin (archaellin)